LPTREELRSIVDYSRTNFAIDTVCFPDIGQNGWYWSSSPFSASADYDWIVSFGNGGEGTFNTGDGHGHVRLVRGGQALPIADFCWACLPNRGGWRAILQ
jgi:hypothetical protein